MNYLLCLMKCYYGSLKTYGKEVSSGLVIVIAEKFASNDKKILNHHHIEDRT